MGHPTYSLPSKVLSAQRHPRRHVDMMGKLKKADDMKRPSQEKKGFGVTKAQKGFGVNKEKGFSAAKEKKVKLEIPEEFKKLPSELEVKFDSEDFDEEEYFEDEEDFLRDIHGSNIDLINNFLEKGSAESEYSEKAGDSENQTDVDAMIDAIQGDGDFDMPSEFRNLPRELRVKVGPEDYKEALEEEGNSAEGDYDEMFDDEDDPLKPGVDLSLDGEVDEDKHDELLDHIEADAFAMLKAANLSDRRLSVVVCDDEVIRDMNSKWRGKDRPTDVLSFPADDDALVGDLIVSIPTAERQAAERGHSLRNEVRILMVHGLLHLCGFDHEDEGNEHATMLDAEEVLMELLGWQGKGLVALGEDAEEEPANKEADDAEEVNPAQ